MRNYRSAKYSKSPVTPEEIELEFKKDDVFEDLGLSQHREHGVLFNKIDIQDEYCNCIFSSANLIDLVKKKLEPNERFFVMDGTFRITPHGPFKQVLIIHVEYDLKV